MFVNYILIGDINKIPSAVTRQTRVKPTLLLAEACLLIQRVPQHRYFLCQVKCSSRDRGYVRRPVMSPRAQALGIFLKKGPMSLHLRHLYIYMYVFYYYLFIIAQSVPFGFGRTFGFTSLIPISLFVYLPPLLSTLLYCTALIILFLKTKN